MYASTAAGPSVRTRDVPNGGSFRSQFSGHIIRALTSTFQLPIDLKTILFTWLQDRTAIDKNHIRSNRRLLHIASSLKPYRNERIREQKQSITGARIMTASERATRRLRLDSKSGGSIVSIDDFHLTSLGQ